MAAETLRLADTFCRKAEACLSTGNPDGAEALAAEAVARDPACVWGHQVLARVALARDEIQNARSILERRAELPRDDAHGRWGEIAEQIGDLDAAMQIYTEHLDRAPDDRDALYRLALLHADRGEPGKAQARLQALVRVAPDFAPACFELARLYDEDGMLGLAAEIYDRGLQIDPHNGEARSARDLLAARQEEASRFSQASA